MKILLLGANGQVGHELMRSLSPLGDVVPCTRDGRLAGGGEALACDLATPGAAQARIQDLAPDLVVNASAYTAVDRAEEEPELAMRINGEAVSEIAGACTSTGARLIHYSTDYVFDGSAQRPYRETDPVAPVSAYGRSKCAGEQALAASGAHHVVFRLAWVYAARGRNFALTMLRLAAERDQLGVVDDQIGAPTPARWIADATAHVAHAHHDLQGTYHLAPAGQTSWFGYCRVLLESARAVGALQRLPELRAVTSAEYPTAARRPAYSCLDSGKLRADTGLSMPDWRLGVEQLVSDLRGRP